MEHAGWMLRWMLKGGACQRGAKPPITYPRIRISVRRVPRLLISTYLFVLPRKLRAIVAPPENEDAFVPTKRSALIATHRSRKASSFHSSGFNAESHAGPESVLWVTVFEGLCMR